MRKPVDIVGQVQCQIEDGVGGIGRARRWTPSPWPRAAGARIVCHGTKASDAARLPR